MKFNLMIFETEPSNLEIYLLLAQYYYYSEP